MASPVTVEKFRSRNAMKGFDFDTGSTSISDVAWVDMRDYSDFVVSLFHSVGTASVQEFAIIANAESDGSGTDVEIATHALGTDPDAVADQIFLEINQQQIAKEGEDAGVADLRYVSATVRMGATGDEFVVTYIRANSKRPTTGLTDDIIA